MKNVEKKVLRPSKTGLCAKSRYEVELQGSNRLEQEKELVLLAMNLHEAIHGVLHSKETPGVFSWKSARFISKSFLFKGFTDEEVYDVLHKVADRIRKMKV